MSHTDEPLRNHLETCTRSSTYISKTTLNTLLKRIKIYMQGKIVDEINQQQFGLVADEVTDSANWEQLGIVVRCVKDDRSIKRLLEYVKCPNIRGTTIADLIIKALDDVGLNIEKCRAKPYDGAGIVAGKQQEPVNQLKVKPSNENAMYSHCASYELNLALSKSSKVSDIYNMVCLLQALGKFFVNSPKRKQELERKTSRKNVEEKQFNTMKRKIKPLCETRWIERHTAFEDLHLLYKHVLGCLSNMNNNNRMWGPKAVTETSSILNQMTDTKFFISFHTCKFLLSFTKPLSTALQGSDMDVVSGYPSATTLTNE